MFSCLFTMTWLLNCTLGWRDYARKVSNKIEFAYRSGETKTRVQTGKPLDFVIFTAAIGRFVMDVVLFGWRFIYFLFVEKTVI